MELEGHRARFMHRLSLKDGRTELAICARQAAR
jgi:hypothetical protein